MHKHNFGWIQSTVYFFHLKNNVQLIILQSSILTLQTFILGTLTGFITTTDEWPLSLPLPQKPFIVVSSLYLLFPPQK